MELITTNNYPSFIFPPNPTPRTIIIHSTPRKWHGCIYFSSYESTGQILLLIKNTPGEYEGLFFKNPISIFKSSNKSDIETKITNKLKSILKNK